VREAKGERPDLARAMGPSSNTPDLEPGQEVSEGQEELPPPPPSVPAAPPVPSGAAKPGSALPPVLPRFIPAAPH
jgi:hypothetical protein